MFEKIKEKAQKVKQWAIDNKAYLAYVGGCAAGALCTALVYMVDDKRKEAKEDPRVRKVLSMEKYANKEYGCYGSIGPKVSELSDKMVDMGMNADDEVIGALVYSRKQ